MQFSSSQTTLLSAMTWPSTMLSYKVLSVLTVLLAITIQSTISPPPPPHCNLRKCILFHRDLKPLAWDPGNDIMIYASGQNNKAVQERQIKKDGILTLTINTCKLNLFFTQKPWVTFNAKWATCWLGCQRMPFHSYLLACRGMCVQCIWVSDEALMMWHVLPVHTFFQQKQTRAKQMACNTELWHVTAAAYILAHYWQSADLVVYCIAKPDHKHGYVQSDMHTRCQPRHGAYYIPSAASVTS